MPKPHPRCPTAPQQSACGTTKPKHGADDKKRSGEAQQASSAYTNSSAVGFTARDYIWTANARVHPSDVSSPNFYSLQVFQMFMCCPASVELTLPRDAAELTRMGGSALQTRSFTRALSHQIKKIKKSISSLKLSLATPCAFNSALSRMCPVTQSFIS